MKRRVSFDHHVLVFLTPDDWHPATSSDLPPEGSQLVGIEPGGINAARQFNGRSLRHPDQPRLWAVSATGWAVAGKAVPA